MLMLCEPGHIWLIRTNIDHSFMTGNFLYFIAWSKYWVLGARFIAGEFFLKGFVYFSVVAHVELTGI